MDTLYLLVAVILLFACICSLIRAGLGPTWFDRMLVVNTFTTKSILLISVYFFATGHPQHIDIALLYAVINYIGILVFVKYMNLQYPIAETNQHD